MKIIYIVYLCCAIKKINLFRFVLFDGIICIIIDTMYVHIWTYTNNDKLITACDNTPYARTLKNYHYLLLIYKKQSYKLYYEIQFAYKLIQ